MWCQAEMSVAAHTVSIDNRRGMSGGTETQTTWAVREVPAGPLPGRESPMAVNSKSSPERAGDREKALETALLQIERQFGKGSVMRLGEETRVPVEVIPTGSIALDVALGLGGLPRGRIVEIYGPESSGKTTVALHAVANAQKAGGIAAFIDAEHALDPDYAKKLGCDTDALLVSQPDTGEQALEIADMLIRSGAIDIVVIDSVAALVPKAEIEGEMGDSHVGLQARLMSQALRKITGALSQTKTTAIFINQLREKVGVMFGCMSYSTRVTLADGTQEKIGKIVNQRMDVEVLSYEPGDWPDVSAPDRELVQQRQGREVPSVQRREVGKERSCPVRRDREPPRPHSGRMAPGRGTDSRRPRHGRRNSSAWVTSRSSSSSAR